ncbi:sphingomyelin phosphodiesterase [Marinagarivorans cellulosilyticus]|uniref:Endonuclease/exonuclease/phosphatase domain-containing protein n=1 Tax=Marinagarivorans cellulosilyticus TaxID=2721545 RepID=A0AAN1WLF1_9GAMM|nr:sphingomyelin phosphodiesterase [Marinagarivorans cellulosilyticus]BCD99760.1 hypothetical protein MARGE09_P3962 [Marinagarivorans cellulosilyticus]
MITRYSWAVLVMCFLLTSCVGDAPDNSPYSDIFFVNNTHQTLNVQVQQSGDALLQQSQQYTVQEKSIPPYSTQLILRINRQDYSVAGQEFLFSTHVEGEHINVELQQKIISLQTGSSLSFSALVDSAPLPLQTDQNIYRIELKQANGLTAELAFKAKNKGLYEDIHYVYTQAYSPAKLDPSADKLSVLSYNIWALPFISDEIKVRLQAMPPYLQQYDVLLLQEAFSNEYENLVNTLEEEFGYTYVSNMLNSPNPNLFNGGVILLSRYPIVRQAQAYFPDCAGNDCLADKGINYMEVIKNGRSYHIFSAHTASFDSDIARLYRQNQFQQMRDFTEAMEIPKNETVIYGGDFNVNKWLFPEDYQQMLATLEAAEPEYTGYSKATFDPFINVHGSAFGSGGDHIEYLDYVLVSEQYGASSSLVNNVRIPRSTSPALWNLWDLSDHFPVEAFIE